MPALPHPSSFPHNRKDLLPGHQKVEHRAEIAELVAAVVASIPTEHDITHVRVEWRDDGRGIIDVHVRTKCLFPAREGSMDVLFEHETRWIGMRDGEGEYRAHPSAI